MAIRGRKPSLNNDTESLITEKEIGVMANMQDVHFYVRTVTKDSRFGPGGEIPMLEVESQLRNEWLAKGWRIVSVFPIGRSDDSFELAVTLVKDVVL